MPKSKKSNKHTIILAMPAFIDMFGSYYAIEIMKGVGKVLEGSPYDLQLHMFDPEEGERPLEDHLTNITSLAGILFADIDGNGRLITTVKKKKIPYIIMNNLFENNETNCIGIDNRVAAKEATEYLIRLGHTDIATITGNMKTQSAVMRVEGYREALADAGIKEVPEYIVNGAYNREKAQEAMMQLLRGKTRPTAVFAASDLMAFGAIMVALREDVRVPEDVSVVGFDNSPLAALGHVTITTVSQPLSEMGQIAATELVDMIERGMKETFKHVLPTTLIMGSSCRKL